MSYIVMDLEWNQAMSSHASIFNYLPIHLSGEIIQIGAVKLDEDYCPGEEFSSDVKPVFFRSMHYKVKKLTGLNKERLSHGDTFPAVFQRFREWCGEDVTFITWGNDDRRIMEQNIIVHDLDWDWIGDWINLQLIYNIQTDGDKNQKSLATAMEHFGIEQTRIAHDALGDAYNTALVCSRLDFAEGLEQYDNAASLLSTHVSAPKLSGEEEDALDHRSFGSFPSRAEAFLDPEVGRIVCPVCGGELSLSRWVNQGDRRYMTLGECSEHGKYLVRLKFRKAEDSSWSVNRILYKADDEKEQFYRDKAVQSRRRGRGRRHSRRSGSAADNT
ncbi:MAG: exonuclease domain-containing protein [Oscillospiraceae bacterium]|nr:exonuclease domain-containing protein [Oscillospiraceae bacterium]